MTNGGGLLSSVLLLKSEDKLSEEEIHYEYLGKRKFCKKTYRALSLFVVRT